MNIDNILRWLKAVTVPDQNDYNNDIEVIESYIQYLESCIEMLHYDCPPFGLTTDDIREKFYARYTKNN